MNDHFWKGKKLNKNRVSLFQNFSLLNFHILMKEGRELLKNYFSKEVIKLNYMQYPAQQQQQYAGNTRPVYQPNGWNNRIRPVSSIEEVRAASIDFDGSVFYFSDLANKRIYTKQINLDGTAQLNMYELKEFRLSPVIDVGDFETKLRNATKYLEKGDRIKLTIRFKGRQMAHTELGKEVLDRFASRVTDYADIEQKPKLDGKTMTMLLVPKKDK